MELTVAGREVHVLLTVSGTVPAVVSAFDATTGEPLFQGSLMLDGRVVDVHAMVPQPDGPYLGEAVAAFDQVSRSVWRAALVDVLTHRQDVLRGAAAGSDDSAALRRSSCLLAALTYPEGPAKRVLLKRANFWVGTVPDLIAAVEAEVAGDSQQD